MLMNIFTNSYQSNPSGIGSRLQSSLLVLLCLFLGMNTNFANGDNPMKPNYTIGFSADADNDLGVLVVSQPSYTTCATSQNGELRAVGFNGSPPYTYLWSNGATTVEVDGLGLGTYTVTITDTDGNTAEGSGEITLHPEGVWLMLSATAACDGQDNGTAHVSAMLGTPPYTFVWSNGDTGEDVTGLAEGVYRVTATDAFGCTNEESIYIDANDELDIHLTSNYETCIGSMDAKITAIVDGGQSPYTYLWSNGQTTQIATGFGAGIHSVTVTDAGGCTAVASEEVELSPEGVWIMLSATDADCGVDNGTIHVGVMTGVPPYTFEWSDPSIGNTPDPTGLGPGTYEVTVTDDNGCTAVDDITVNTGNSQLSLDTDGVDVTCTELGSATVNILSGSAPFTIQWDDPNNSTTATITDLEPGIYTVEVTDANGCFGMATRRIEDTCDPCDADAGTLTPNPAPDCIDGSTTISANPNGDAVVPAGFELTYVLTSGNGLLIQEISSSPSFDITVSGLYTIHSLVYDPNTLDLSTLTIGVSTGFDVNALLEQGGGDICGSLDVDGASFQLDSGFNLDIIPQDPTICPGGSVMLSTTATDPGLTYSWTTTGGTFNNPASATPTYTMMMPGTYTITVVATDLNTGCEGEATTTVTVLDPPSISIQPADEAVCAGSSINFTASGVPAGSTYSWTATGGSFDNATSGAPTWTMMMPGTYTISLTIVTSDGCEASASTTATIYPALTDCTASVTSSYNEGTDISIRGGSDGSATVTASGTGLTYLWSTGATTQDVDGLSAGTYTVTVTNANGCSCVASVTLEDPAKLGDFVWLDENRNGIQDPGENGIEGVKATLTGTTVGGLDIMRMLFTDATGMYMFDGLLPGSYKVTFEQPVGFAASDANQGGDDTVDSDADPITGMTQMVDLAAGEYNPTLDAGFYPCINIGDYVWWDENHNGAQDPDEIGVEGVQVKLMRAGFDGIFCTDDDQIWMEETTGPNGEYLFECVEPGEYYISFMNIPADWKFTGQDETTDDLDSDADPDTGKTDPFTVVNGQPDDLTFDAGIRPICDNFRGNGGEIITKNEPICPGESPYEFLNVIAPDGGSGPIEYLWMFTTDPGPHTPPNGFTPIPNSNTLNLQYGPIFVTTTFVRCARRLDCPDYLESNWITVIVDESACNVTSMLIDLNGSLNVNDQVELDWSMVQENEIYDYNVQKSYNGMDYFDIQSQKGLGNTGELNKYNFMDTYAKEGMNYYRIKATSPTGEVVFSNGVEFQVSPEILVNAYPNPFVEVLELTPMQELQDDLIVEIYNESGALLFTGTYDKASEKISIEVAKNGSDVRNLILRLRHPNITKQKVMRVIQTTK